MILNYLTTEANEINKEGILVCTDLIEPSDFTDEGTEAQMWHVKGEFV